MSMAWLLTSSVPVVWVGIAQSPDGTADVLEFQAPDGPVRILIDSKSRLPLMLSWTGVTPQLNFNQRGGGNQGRGGRGNQGGRGGPTLVQGTVTMFLSDYKTVNNIRLPHLIQKGPNGETTEELVVRNYRINPSFNDSLFQQ
jgi:hypothetical protein